MQEQRAYELERRDAGLFFIAGGAHGWYYCLHPQDRRIAICGEAGIALLTPAQARAVAVELGEVLCMYGNARAGDDEAHACRSQKRRKKR